MRSPKPIAAALLLPALLLIIVGILLHRADTAPGTLQDTRTVANVRAPAQSPPSATQESKETEPPQSPLNPVLAEAVQHAKFVESVRQGIPPERGTARHMLTALQATLFINDYLMTAKGKGSNTLELSAVAIKEAFSAVSSNKTLLNDNLSSYSSFPETLEEHYARVVRNQKLNGQVHAIESALRASGAPLEMESDLLLDCMRLVCFRTEVDDMYGPISAGLPNPNADPAEAAACVDSFDKVFNYRFTNKFRLAESTARELTQRLRVLTLSGVSPADLEVPVVLN